VAAEITLFVEETTRQQRNTQDPHGPFGDAGTGSDLRSGLGAVPERVEEADFNTGLKGISELMAKDGIPDQLWVGADLGREHISGRNQLEVGSSNDLSSRRRLAGRSATISH
jgi:hypothetical protein